MRRQFTVYFRLFMEVRKYGGVLGVKEPQPGFSKVGGANSFCIKSILKLFNRKVSAIKNVSGLVFFLVI